MRAVGSTNRGGRRRSVTIFYAVASALFFEMISGAGFFDLLRGCSFWDSLQDDVPANGYIDVRVKDVGNDIAVEVQDDGPGIESSEVDKIFNCFNQIRMKLRAGKEQELDIGPPIAKELVEMQGGCLWVESRDRQGKNICFTLPKAGVRQEVTPVAVNPVGNSTIGTVTQKEENF